MHHEITISVWYTSGRVLASSAGGPGFNPQSRTASYQRRYKKGTSGTLVYHSTLEREQNVMGKIWYRNPSKTEFIGRCGGNEKPE